MTHDKSARSKSDEARSNIFARIRKAQGRGAPTGDASQGLSGSADELAAAATYLKAHPRGPLPGHRG